MIHQVINQNDDRMLGTMLLAMHHAIQNDSAILAQLQSMEKAL